MSATCPNGHASATADYCDRCGAPIAPAAAPPPPGAPPSGSPATATLDAAAAGGDLDTSTSAHQQPCPQCGAPRTGDDRYCEGCGYDFVSAPAPIEVPGGEAPGAGAPGDGPAAAVWEAVASADRAQFDRLAPAELKFPGDYTERRFPLVGAKVVIGRTHPPEPPPDINLAGAPEDPAVSHKHAVLERRQDGSYQLRDLGSTNGTTLNDDPTPISPEAGAPLAEGDRIHVGAWTTLTLRRTGQP